MLWSLQLFSTWRCVGLCVVYGTSSLKVWWKKASRSWLGRFAFKSLSRLWLGTAGTPCVTTHYIYFFFIYLIACPFLSRRAKLQIYTLEERGQKFYSFLGHLAKSQRPYAILSQRLTRWLEKFHGKTEEGSRWRWPGLTKLLPPKIPIICSCPNSFLFIYFHIYCFLLFLFILLVFFFLFSSTISYIFIVEKLTNKKKVFFCKLNKHC